MTPQEFTSQPEEPEQPLLQFVPELVPETGEVGEAALAVPTPEEVAVGGVRGFVRRNKGKLVLGAMGVSAAIAIWGSPQETVDALPPVLGSMLAAEALWIGGAAVALGAVGKRINPKELWAAKDDFKNEIGKQISEATVDNRLFKAGLVVNTGAALAEFVIPTAIVVTKLPPETWGVLTFSAVDLAATVAVRAYIFDHMKQAKRAKLANAPETE